MVFYKNVLITFQIKLRQKGGGQCPGAPPGYATVNNHTAANVSLLLEYLSTVGLHSRAINCDQQKEFCCLVNMNKPQDVSEVTYHLFYFTFSAFTNTNIGSIEPCLKVRLPIRVFLHSDKRWR